MVNILVYVESHAQTAASSSLELIAAAQGLAKPSGGSVEALVLAADTGPIATQLTGADRNLTVAHPALSPYVSEAHGRALTHVVQERQPDLVLMAYSSTGLDLGPTLAMRTQRPLVSYCTHIELGDGAVTTQSQTHGGKLVTVSMAALPAILAVTPGSFSADDVAAAAGEIVALEPPAGLDNLRVTFKSSQAPDPDAVDITQCDKLVCVGRGIGDADSIDLARQVADRLNAEISGSRPVIDAGWLAKERQVGKSGHKVKPRLYIAAGVSGAPEHLEGMSSAELIIAINSDPRAPIFDHAHFGTTEDLLDLLPALSERLDGTGT